MNKHLKEFLKYASLPIILLGAFLVLAIIYIVFDIPSYTEIREWVKDLFLSHGYWIIFLGALAEGILLANWYLPGSVVVVMGVALASETGLNPVLAVILIILGFFLTTLLNYAIGRYGWYRVLMKCGLKDTINNTKKRVEKHGLKIIFSTYFHPNVGALTATSAGILQLCFKRFTAYSIAALVAWNTFWGIVVYIWGPPIVELVNYKNTLIFIGIWIVGLLVIFTVKRKRKLVPVIQKP